MSFFNKLNKIMRLKRLLLTAACVVVFFVTYALILPAITLEKETYCGMEEHQHTDDCYTVTKNCVCGQEESKGHKHSDDCYTEEKILICELEEDDEHQHSEDCYETEKILTCGKQEVEGHSHDDSCYEEERELTCGKQEHIHSSECFVDPNAEETSGNTGDNDMEEDDESEEDVTVPAENGFDSSGNGENNNEDESDKETQNPDESSEDETKGIIETEKETEETESEEVCETAQPDPDLTYPETVLHEKIKKSLLETWIEVEVKVPEGTLPKGSRLVIEKYQPEKKYQKEYDEKLDAALSGALMDHKALTISFVDADGQPVIPLKDVQVTVRDSMIEDAEKTELVLIDDELKDDLQTYSLDVKQEDKNAVSFTLYPEDPSVLAAASTTLAKKLTAEGDGYTITMNCGAKAGIPEGSSLSAEEILQNASDYQGYVSGAEKTLGVEEGEVSYARFFDITIIGPEGNEIQPREPVDVKIVLDDLQREVKGDETPQVVHFGDEHTEEIDVEKRGSAVNFEAEGFSVYGVIATTSIEKTVLASDGHNYKVTVEYGEDAGIPENADLFVEEITQNTTDYRLSYDSYVSMAEDALGWEAGSASYIRMFNIKIVDKDDPEIKYQPAEGTTVDVKIELADRAGSETAQVVHIEDGSNKGSVVEDVRVEGRKVSFAAEGFSVYAVVDEGQVDESRMTLNFWNMSITDDPNTDKDERLIATVYVKNDDDTDAEIEQIIYDPGIGEVPSNSLFKGWILDKANYGADDADDKMDITEIRTWAKNKANANEIEEGETHDFYAMVFQTYSVAFLDEDGVTIHAEALIFKPGDRLTYVVNQPYTPKGQDSQFQGWYSNPGVTKAVDNTPIGTAETGQIPNTTEVVISSDTVFTPNAPNGYWLVFNSNTQPNTSRATYTPPQFVMDGAVTIRPDNPTRLGYTFDGWYRNAECTGSQFVFGSSLSARTELFAKWNPVETANYAVIIWQQNVDATGYDFVEAVNLSGSTGTAINTVVQQGTGDDAYAVINNTNKIYEGFHLKEFDQNITITPEGNAVLNVYYDRTEYTLRFFYARSYDYALGGTTETYRDNIGNANNGTIIGITGSQNTEYYTTENGNTRVYWRNGYFRTRNNNNGTRYNGAVWEVKERQVGGTTRTYIQVNANNEGFLRHNGNTLERSLGYYLTNDYQRLTDGNTWKDVNNSSVNGNPLNLVSSAYLAKPEVSTGSIQINNVTTDVATSFGNTTRQTVDTIYYYLDVKVRYGQSLDDLWPTPETTFIAQDLTTYNRQHDNRPEPNITPLLTGSWASQNNISGLYHQMTEDLFVGNDTIAYFDIYWRIQEYYHYTYNAYFSTLEGETGTTTYKGDSYNLLESYEIGNGVGWGTFGQNAVYPTDSGQGFHDVMAVTYDGTDIVGRVDSQTGTNGSDGTINVYYKRKVHNIVYHDGIYVNGDGGTIKNLKDNAPLKETAVLYGQDISPYAEGEAKYYEPTAPEGFVFEGWYMDSEGQQPYTFSGNMPDKDIEVYAKWRQVQYRVFLHPQVPTDATGLDWGDQSMSFRVNDGEKIAGGNKIIGITDQYDFIGWYTDPAYNNSFEMSAVTLNNNTVTAAYDTTDDGVYNPTEPTELDERGEPLSNENRDAERGRYWITKKLDLYGKWRARLEGARGINVVYTANSLNVTGQEDVYGHFGDNSTTFRDPTYYLDRAEASAAGASVPNNTDKYQFMYWVVQRWDETLGRYVDTDEIVYPGNTFEVLKAYAKVEDIPGSTDPENNKTYTVQLRAQYGEVDAPTPTHIWWFKNDVAVGTSHEAMREDADLQINEAVVIPDAPVREGYTFLGWARVDSETSGSSKTGSNTPVGNGLALTKSNLFLTYHKAEGTNPAYYTSVINETSRTVAKVAADEASPYHDMYAVWAKSYTVVVKKSVDSGLQNDKEKEFGFESSINYENDVSTESFTLKDYDTYEVSKSYTVIEGSTFKVTETDPGSDFEVSVTETYVDSDNQPQAITGLQNGSTITIQGDTEIVVTNKRKGVDVTILKVDGTTDEPLPGATFQLTRKVENTTNYEAFGDPFTIDEEDASYVVTLLTGDYILTETGIPRGYVVTSETAFTVHAETGAQEIITGVTGDASAEGTKKSTLKVKNTRGAALPSTGGPGKKMFILFGSILLAIAGVGFLARRRAKS